MAEDGKEACAYVRVHVCARGCMCGRVPRVCVMRLRVCTWLTLGFMCLFMENEGWVDTQQVMAATSLS